MVSTSDNVKATQWTTMLWKKQIKGVKEKIYIFSLGKQKALTQKRIVQIQ